MTSFTATTGVDTFLGGAGSDTVIVTATNQVSAADTFDGGAGTDTLQIGAAGAGTSIDLSGAASDGVHGFLNIEGIAFANTSGSSTATFNSAQFGAGKISALATLTGSAAGNDTLVIDMVSGGSLSLGFTLVNWTGSDTVAIVASTGSDFIQGGLENDTFIFTSTAQVGPGDLFDGGNGFDTIQVGTAGAGVSIDFSGAATGNSGFQDMDGIAFANTSGTSTATFRSDQFGLGQPPYKIANNVVITGSGGTNALVVNMVTNGSLDLSGWTFANWTNGVDTLTVNGSAGNDTLTASTAADTFLGGAGSDTVIVTATNQVSAADTFDGGAGTDILQIGAAGAGTSIDLSGAASDGVHGFLNIEGIAFANTSGSSTATLNSAQFGAGKISALATLTGSAAGNDTLVIDMVSGGSLSLGFTLVNWTSSDTVAIVASTGSDFIQGGLENDTFIFTSTAQVGPGDLFDGGNGFDTIQVGTAGAGVSIDFSGAATGNSGFQDMDGIAFANTSGASTATFRSDQFGNGQPPYKISSTATLTGGAGNDTLVIDMVSGGSLSLGFTLVNWTSSDTVAIVASTGSDFIQGGLENDTFIFTSTAQVGPGDLFDGGNGFDTIQVGTAGAGISIDFSGAATGNSGFQDMDGIAFANTSGTSTATFRSDQFGNGQPPYKISSTATLTGGAGNDTLVIDMVSGGSLSLGFTLVNWTSSDTVAIVASTGSDFIQGGLENDTFIFTSTAQVGPGDLFDGGNGFDTIQVGTAGAGISVDFSGAATGNSGFQDMDGIAFANTSGTSTATFRSDQFGLGQPPYKIANNVVITGSAGTNALVVNMVTNGSLDLSGWTFANWTTGVDTLTVNGSAGNDTITGSTATETILGGAGNDLIYGNTSQTTADNASHMTLDGGTGTNALYGSSAFNTFVGGDAGGGSSQMWGGGSKMAGVSGFTNNTLSFAGVAAGQSVYVDLSAGHNAYINSGANNNGTYTFEDSIANIPNVIGSSGGDLLLGSTFSGTLSGGAGNDLLYGNTSQATADTASQVVLDGGTGNNALYGSSAFNTFLAGDASGGFNQIWGAASKMAGVSGFTNNTLSFAETPSGESVYVDLLNGHNAYVNSGPQNNGTYTLEDSISNVPNLTGSAGGDVVIADNGVDRVTGGAGGDQLYAGSGAGSQDTFIYTAYGDSNLVAGYDAIYGFKTGADKIDISSLHSDAGHLLIQTSGTSNSVYLEQTPGTLNKNTDLALVVNTTTGGLHASDFVF